MVLVHDHNGVFFLGIFAFLKLLHVVTSDGSLSVVFGGSLLSLFGRAKSLEGILVVFFDAVVQLSGPPGVGLLPVKNRILSESLQGSDFSKCVGSIGSWSLVVSRSLLAKIASCFLLPNPLWIGSCGWIPLC